MKKHFILGILFLILIISSCKDITTKTMDTNEAQTLLTESVTAYSIFASTQEETTIKSAEAENNLKSATITTDNYPIVSVDPLDLTSWPKTITINYGPDNITGWDGVERRGTIIVYATNFPGFENATWQITFDEFYHNDYLVEGTQTITYKGLNESENPYYTCKVEDGMITSPEGKAFHFEQSTVREWVGGHETPLNLCDDDYQITGEHSGISSDGYTYSVTTKEPLLLNLCCRYIEDGKLNVELQDANLNCEIDYRPGNDTGELCNDLAAFNIFGNTITVHL